jgi:hypothetical protein
VKPPPRPARSPTILEKEILIIAFEITRQYLTYTPSTHSLVLLNPYFVLGYHTVRYSQLSLTRSFKEIFRIGQYNYYSNKKGVKFCLRTLKLSRSALGRFCSC